MIKRLIASVVVVLVLVTAVVAGVVREGTFSAVSDGINITIRWISDDEGGVARYELERKAGINGVFVLISPVPMQGNNAVYEYIDDSAFLSESSSETVYQYQLKIVHSNGAPPEIYGPITVRHEVSGVRKTWGSIKAMFR